MVLLIVAIAGCRDSAWTRLGTAELVLSQMRLGGEAYVAKRIDTDQKFGQSVMEGIASGDSLWLEVAKNLTPASASAEASLTIALASALPRAPAKVLPLLAKKYSLEEVCGIPFLEPDSSTIRSYYADASAALGGVQQPALVRGRDACKVTLDSARSRRLARIDSSYMVKNKPVAPRPAPRRGRRR